VRTSTFAFVLSTEYVWLLTCDKEAVYVPRHAMGTTVKATEISWLVRIVTTHV